MLAKSLRIGAAGLFGVMLICSSLVRLPARPARMPARGQEAFHLTLEYRRIVGLRGRDISSPGISFALRSPPKDNKDGCFKNACEKRLDRYFGLH